MYKCANSCLYTRIYGAFNKLVWGLEAQRFYRTNRYFQATFQMYPYRCILYSFSEHVLHTSTYIQAGNIYQRIVRVVPIQYSGGTVIDHRTA
jgi:hypothetical protein